MAKDKKPPQVCQALNHSLLSYHRRRIKYMVGGVILCGPLDPRHSSHPSSRRKPGSRASFEQTSWIPAFAGMTVGGRDDDRGDGMTIGGTGLCQGARDDGLSPCAILERSCKIVPHFLMDKTATNRKQEPRYHEPVFIIPLTCCAPHNSDIGSGPERPAYIERKRMIDYAPS